MQVETFECSETAAEPIEATEEAIALMESLGCAGQLKMVRVDESKPAVRSPYREMTAEEAFVYRIMCPDSKPLNEYSQSPIPLRVLQVAAHVQSLDLPEMRYFFVWDRVSAEVKDPVLVAKDYSHDYDGASGKTYILARWGEELETFSVLLKRAIVIKREQLVQQAEKLAVKLRNASDAINELTDAEIVKAGKYSLYGPGV